MQTWISVLFGFVLMLLGGVLLQHKVLDVFSLNRNLSLDVYFPSDACTHALDFSEELNTDARHFLLISNCFHSKSFQQSEVYWRFDQLLPSLIYDGTSGDQGSFFQSWLQKKTGRVENLPDSRFDGLRLFHQPTDRKQITALHFLCAHTELLAQHPKYAPESRKQQNYYALVSSCLENTSHPHYQSIETTFVTGSLGDKLLDTFSQDVSNPEIFRALIEQ